MAVAVSCLIGEIIRSKKITAQSARIQRRIVEIKPRKLIWAVPGDSQGSDFIVLGWKFGAVSSEAAV